MFVLFFCETIQAPSNPLTSSEEVRDTWEIFEDHAEAVERYQEIINLDNLHSAGVAKIDPELSTDWF